MDRKTRKLILFGLVTVLISVTGWSVHATVQASEDGLVRTESQPHGLPAALDLDEISYIQLQKWNEPPDEYADLTEAMYT